MVATTSLPCSSHGKCTYHKSKLAHASAADVNKPGFQAATIPGALATYKSRLNQIASKLPPRKTIAPIQTLPTELILITLSHLDITEQACLSLTCKHFARILGPSLWPLTSKAKGASWSNHDDLLDILQKDVGDDYWRCRDCMKFHPRRKLLPKHHEERATKLENEPRNLLSTMGRLLQASKIRDPALHLGPLKSPVYTLGRPLITAILTAHHLSNPDDPPPCLNAFQCRGTLGRNIPLANPPLPPSPLPQTPPRPLTLTYTYTHVSKIVLNTVLLRSTYTFFLSSIPYIIFYYEASIRYLSDALSQLRFRFCTHGEVFACVESMLQLEAGDGGIKRGRCKYCPTQWIAHRERNKHVSPTIRFTVYQNLGRGEGWGDSAGCDRWRFLMQPQSWWMQDYKWGEEDVEEAFNRILCSTEEEFRRQLNRSDGRGTWYDPSLQRRAYKTLPQSIAAAL